ncbi:hypothetical protein GGR50DRAFT_683094 [Xylaria sp. CBS 124048]|nr:hypothetical protein GGR50DRAFT_683094 [Xylaria sp. CBS 124048]
MPKNKKEKKKDADHDDQSGVPPPLFFSFFLFFSPFRGLLAGMLKKRVLSCPVLSCSVIHLVPFEKDCRALCEALVGPAFTYDLFIFLFLIFVLVERLAGRMKLSDRQ